MNLEDHLNGLEGSSESDTYVIVGFMEDNYACVLARGLYAEMRERVGPDGLAMLGDFVALGFFPVEDYEQLQANIATKH